MKTITLPFTPHKFQLDWWKNQRRFNVKVIHRRFGKTVYEINRQIRKALMAVNNRTQKQCCDWQGAYIAPQLKQAKRVAWDKFKFFTNNIPGMSSKSFNESELRIVFPNKAKIYLLGSDNPDSIKGMYLDDATLDEMAQMHPNIWGEVVLPALTDRKGGADFIGTTKGIDQFHEIYHHALSDTSGEWSAVLLNIYDTLKDESFRKLTGLTHEEIEFVRKNISETQFRQEWMCDFQASVPDAFISIDIAYAARGRKIRETEFAGAPKIIGVDVGRDNDASIITKRQGLACLPQIKLHIPDNMIVASKIAYEIDSWKPDAVFIDQGAGVGVIDRLRQLGHSVIEVPFGSTPDDSVHYANKRAEMYGRAKEWLKLGGCLPDDEKLTQQLTISQLKERADNKIILESKDNIRKRLGQSPDEADSFVLTFAQNIRPKGRPIPYNLIKRVKRYNVFSRFERRM